MATGGGGALLFDTPDPPLARCAGRGDDASGPGAWGNTGILPRRRRVVRMNPEAKVTREAGVRKFLAPYSPLRPPFRRSRQQPPLDRRYYSQRGGNLPGSWGRLLQRLSRTRGGRCLALAAGRLSWTATWPRPYLHRVLGEPNFVGLTSSLEGEKPLEESGFEVAQGLLVVPTGPVPTDPQPTWRPGVSSTPSRL